MIKKKISTPKSQAQAMVEFALALPVLLMLMYGILEAGRMLFLYSSVVTASRQAVRYGTATGSGGDFTADGGPNNSSYNRYQDCYGIRAAANRAGFLGQFDTIAMEFDTGPSSGTTPHCTGGSNFDTDLSPNNNDYRLIVTVSEQFTPLVPNFVPFLNRTFSATSARTILYRVDIVVTAPPGSFGGGGGTGDLTLTISTNPTSVSTAQSVSISYEVQNIGTADVTTPITITTNRGSWSCAGEPAALVVGSSPFTCTGSYTVTQADLDAGVDIVITANAAAGTSSTPNVSVTISVSQAAALTLDKEGPIYAKSQNNTPVNYTYTLINSGNVTLSPPYTVTDDKVASNNITCPSSGDIAPGASTTCTGTYTLHNSDINAGSITNVATATATFGAQTITSNSDSWFVITPPVFLSVTASPASVTSVGQVITYTYTLRNNISSDLTEPYSVTDTRVSSVTCSGTPAPLVPNDTTTCTGSYTVTQADLDAGVPLTSTINASAIKATNPGAGNTLTSNQVLFSVPVTQNPALDLTVTAAPNPATVLNTVVTYTYTLTNNGNVTLSSPSISDDKATATCADTSPIAAGATRVCTGTRTISQADLDDGSVISTTTATTTLNAGIVSSNTVTTTVTTFVGARLTLVITANPNPVSGSGTIVTFTYTLRNTGNIVLSAPYSVTSSLAGSADCSAASATISVGGSTSCVGFYTTQAGDVGTSITDSATATAMDGASTVTSNNATLNVPVNP